MITYHNVHNDFKLNGHYFNPNDLCRLAYSFIKEGNDFEKNIGNFLLDWFDNKPYIILTTSGTTTTPKVVKVEKQAMINSALATAQFFNLTPKNKVLNCLPTKYIAGKMMFVRALVLGFEMDFVAPSSYPLHNNTTHYDFVAMVPLQVENSISQLFQIKKLIIGGAKISKTLENKLINTTTQVYETYSMTETVTHIAVKKLGEKYFSTLPNIQISQDNRNCLIINATHLNVHHIITNDVVEIISNNQFTWLGRYDNIINSGGIKLIPEKIEAKLSLKINKRFYISSVPDEKLGEKVVLIIEGDAFTINENIFNDLDKYEKPKIIKFIPQFIETETGKIKRIKC